MKYSYETKNFYLREMTYDDIDFIKSIWQNNKCMKFYPITFDDQACKDLITRQLNRYKDHNYTGHYLMIRKEDLEPVGQIGFSYQPVEGDYVLELGYLLRDDFWGKGYVTEVAKELLKFGKKYYKEDIHSTINIDNEYSIAVAKRLGAKFIKEYDSSLFGKNIKSVLYKY